MNLLLFTLSQKSHAAKLEDLLKALLKNGLKISPNNCQLFRTELQYMDNTIFIKDRRVGVKPLRIRLEAIQKFTATHNSQGMWKLCRNGKFSKYVLSRITKIIESNI